MVAEHGDMFLVKANCCSLAKISMVAELYCWIVPYAEGCSLAKISMVAELVSSQA